MEKGKEKRKEPGKGKTGRKKRKWKKREQGEPSTTSGVFGKRGKASPQLLQPLLLLLVVS